MPESTPIDFRAPPPSPVAAGRKSRFANEDGLSEFLESLKVPDLVLPDHVFPRQRTLHDIPNLDFESLTSLDKDSVVSFIDSVSKTGCFEVFNHGVPLDLITSGLDSGSGIFGIPAEKRKVVTRSLERPFGFEDLHGDDEKETMSEEFVWCNNDQILKKDMEGILPLGYSNFSVEMENLLAVLETLAGKILQFLEENSSSVTNSWEDILEKQDQQFFGSICYLQKHHNVKNNYEDEESVNNSLRYDVIRMLVRGSEFPHALCVHLCNGAQEFHVYSKKGWVSFHPHQHAFLVTIGDQLQESSRGQYKHVIGRPIFKGEADQQFMSMAFLYSPPPSISKSDKASEKSQAISIGQQIIVVILFTFLYQCISYISKVLGG